MNVPHIPALRLGRAYESLDTQEIFDHRNGSLLARLSMVNPGIIRRDFKRLHKNDVLWANTKCDDLLAASKRAGRYFLDGELPFGSGQLQGPKAFVEVLSASSGLPYALCRANMAKIHHVMTHMDEVLAGLTRGLDPVLLDRGIVAHQGRLVSYYRQAAALGVVLPSNSPGVHSLWLPTPILKTALMLKPGSQEPFTPWRMIQALVAAGFPSEMFGFYPTTHEGAQAIMDGCERAIIFGDRGTVDRYRAKSRVNVHGPGFSKILVGEDWVEEPEAWLDVVVESVLRNGGRSCINSSTIIVPKHGERLAEALAARLAEVVPLPLEDEHASLSAFANPKMAEGIDTVLTQHLSKDGAVDMTARLRGTSRLTRVGGSCFLHPTLVYCTEPDHPLAQSEYMFPFASVVEIAQEKMTEYIGPSLVVSALTRDQSWMRELLACRHIDRLNLGTIPTTRLEWDQPHEGNLFEFLYRRRAIQLASEQAMDLGF